MADYEELIAGGFAACMKIRPGLNRVLSVCLVVGLLSEFVKILSVARILPMVEPAVSASGTGLEYIPTGQFTPYIEMQHLPLELCSLQIVFIAAALWSKTGKWRRRFLSIIFAAGILGGIMGILFAYPTADYTTTASLFASPRIWQFFLYHAMVVTLGLYVGAAGKPVFTFRDFRGCVMAILSMDLLSFYLNSVFSQAVFAGEKAVGIVYRANFFSSYVNPIGLILTEKWQWILYLLIRTLLALALIALLFFMQNTLRKRKK